MLIFWSTEVPLVHQKEDEIKESYKQHKRKIKEFEAIKKEYVGKQQELLQIETSRGQVAKEQANDREEMSDLVAFDKSNVEKLEKRLADTRADSESIKSEKARDEESIKTL